MKIDMPGIGIEHGVVRLYTQSVARAVILKSRYAAALVVRGKLPPSLLLLLLHEGRREGIKRTILYHD